MRMLPLIMYKTVGLILPEKAMMNDMKRMITLKALQPSIIRAIGFWLKYKISDGSLEFGTVLTSQLKRSKTSSVCFATTIVKLSVSFLFASNCSR